MLTGNSQDFQKPLVFYLDPQTRAIAGSTNLTLLLLIHTIFPVFSLASSPLHQTFHFQNKLSKPPLEMTKLNQNPTSPNGWTQLGWGQFFGGVTWRWAQHTCRISAISAPPAPGKESISKPLTITFRNNPNGRQKSKAGPGRKAGLRRRHWLLCLN